MFGYVQANRNELSQDETKNIVKNLCVIMI